MMRHLLIALAAATVVGTSIIPDEALAYRGNRGGAVAARGVRGGAVANRGYGYRPIPGRPIARGAAWGAAGAAAAGAAAVGSGYYYGNGYSDSCYRDAYGQVVCPYQSQY